MNLGLVWFTELQCKVLAQKSINAYQLRWCHINERTEKQINRTKPNQSSKTVPPVSGAGGGWGKDLTHLGDFIQCGFTSKYKRETVKLLENIEEFCATFSTNLNGHRTHERSDQLGFTKIHYFLFLKDDVQKLKDKLQCERKYL